jgi:hypothetical protein
MRCQHTLFARVSGIVRVLFWDRAVRLIVVVLAAVRFEVLRVRRTCVLSWSQRIVCMPNRVRLARLRGLGRALSSLR